MSHMLWRLGSTFKCLGDGEEEEMKKIVRKENRADHSTSRGLGARKGNQ